MSSRHSWQQDGLQTWVCRKCGACRIRLKRSSVVYPVYQYMVKGRTGRLNFAPVCANAEQLGLDLEFRQE